MERKQQLAQRSRNLPFCRRKWRSLSIIMAFESMEKEGRVEAGVLSRCHTMTEDRRCVCGASH